MPPPTVDVERAYRRYEYRALRSRRFHRDGAIYAAISNFDESLRLLRLYNEAFDQEQALLVDLLRRVGAEQFLVLLERAFRAVEAREGQQ